MTPSVLLRLAVDRVVPRPSGPIRPSAATVFVWFTWLAAVLVAFGYVNRYAGRIPLLDDYTLVGLQLEPELPAAAVLWQPHNEHRIPLPKLASWLTARVAGFGVKSVMRMDLGLLAAAAAGLLLAIRSLRGGYRFPDAIIPLVVLSLGHAENLLWAFQVSFILPAVLTLVCLGLVARVGPVLTTGLAAGVGLTALALSLCAVPGQVVAAAVAVWLIGAGVAFRRTRPRPAVVAGCLGALILAGIVVGTTGLPKESFHVRPSLSWLTVRYAFRILGSGWGPVVETVGPMEPTAWPSYLGLATGLVLVLVLLWLGRATWRSGEDRLAAGGYAAILLGLAGLCGAVAYGRAEFNHGYLSPRYSTLVAPLICGLYLAVARFGPPAAGRGLATGLAVTAWAVIGSNHHWAHQFAGIVATQQHRVVHDVTRGVPASFLVDHHGRALYPPDPDYIRPILDRLREKRIPPFQSIPPDPDLAERPVRWQWSATPAADADGWVELPRGDLMRAELSVDMPAGAVAIAVRWSVRGTPRDLRSTVWWAESGDVRREVVNAIEPGESRRTRFWIGRPVERIHLTLHGPSAIRIEAVTVLVEQ